MYTHIEKTVIHSKLKLKNPFLRLFGWSQGLGGVEENESGSYNKNALYWCMKLSKINENLVNKSRTPENFV